MISAAIEFNGNCYDALEFYGSVFGVEPAVLYGDADAVSHAEFVWNEVTNAPARRVLPEACWVADVYDFGVGFGILPDYQVILPTAVYQDAEPPSTPRPAFRSNTGWVGFNPVDCLI